MKYTNTVAWRKSWKSKAAMVMLFLISYGCAATRLKTLGPSPISVDAKATGSFGEHPLPLGGPALDMVVGFVFEYPSVVRVTAGGWIDIHPEWYPGINLSPIGVTVALTRSVFGFLPLEEAIVDSGVDPAELPDEIVDAGALIGAFVPKATVETPGFLAKDDDFPNGGIASDSLFLIGSGPFDFTATEPGTLFLGINDARPGNNSGTFQVSVERAGAH